MVTSGRRPKPQGEDVDVALIGYGEVGRILAEDLRAAGHTVCAFDVKLLAGDEAMRAHARAHGVVLAASHEEAAAAADLVVSAVTARNAIAAVRSCAPGLRGGAFFLDLNSASPRAKLTAAEIVAHAKGRFVEGAVMAAVPPYRLRVPLLLGGPYASLMAPVLEGLGFAPQVCSIKLGVASATKMCRSVMIKGLEALVIESFTAARHYGVEEAVLASLVETFPALDWERQVTYFFQRVIEHGRRRGEEMHEAAATVRDTRLEPWSANATAARQDWMAHLSEVGLFGARDNPAFARNPNWRVEADRILAHLHARAGA